MSKEPTIEEATELRRVNSQCTLLYNLPNLRANMLEKIHDLDSNVFSFAGLPEMIPNRILNSEVERISLILFLQSRREYIKMPRLAQ